MALSAHLFVISAAQELSGENCLYAGIRKATEMVFSFSTQLNTIPRKTQQGYLRMLINEEVTSGLYLPWLRPTELFPPVSGIPISEFYREVIEFITHKQFGKCSLAVIIFSDPTAARDSYIYLKG